MKIDLTVPMGVEVDMGDVRVLCQAAAGNPDLTQEQWDLIFDISNHMIWDDIVTGLALRPGYKIVPA